MILENYTVASAATFENVLVESPDFVGDASELAELTACSMAEMSNLTLAMARVEHKATLNEDGNGAALLEAGVKEFFAKAIEYVKQLWSRFIAWLGSMYTRLKDVFIKRKDWLARNAQALASLSNEDLNGTKASFGVNLPQANLVAAVSDSLKAAHNAIDNVKTIPAGGEKSFMQSATEMVLKPIAKHQMSKSVAKSIHDALIGESKEQNLDASIVKSMLSVARESHEAVEKMNAAKMIAQAAIKNAEGTAVMEGSGKETVNARLAGLREVSTLVHATIAGYSSAIGTANSQAMSVLVVAAKKIKAVNENSSVLESFMS